QGHAAHDRVGAGRQSHRRRADAARGPGRPHGSVRFAPLLAGAAGFLPASRMIRLYQFRPAFGLPNPSPFCMKAETYLRMTGLEYECPRADLRRAPKGKLPYIDDEGTLVSDSSFIIDHLKRKYGDPLDARLDAAARATALALQRLVEENTYWAVVY